MLIDRNLKAWVLEVNDHPSLNIYFDNSMAMDGKVMTDEDICQVDFFVKSKLVEDTINLVKKSREAVTQLTEFRSLTKIHPESESSTLRTTVSTLLTTQQQLIRP